MSDGTPTTIRIIPVVDELELHCHYTRQTNPQPCYIELCPEADPPVVRAEYDCEIGGGVPMVVYHGRRRRYTIPIMLADDANALMEELLPLLRRVCDGYETRWDGSNHTGTLTEDAREAEEEIERICDSVTSDVQVWDAGDWLAGVSDEHLAEEIGLTGDTTDEQLGEIEARLQREAHDDGVHYVEGLDRYLRRLRDRLREEDDEDA